MTYQIGDPNHLGVHNDLTASLRAVANNAGITITLPDEAHLGDLGHVTDHNLLATAMAEIQAYPPALPGMGTWAQITAVTGSPQISEWTDTNGTKWKVYEWHANGTITTTAGILDVLVVGAGSGNTWPGHGGRVNVGTMLSPALNAAAITIGQNDANNQSGSGSGIAGLFPVQGYLECISEGDKLSATGSAGSVRRNDPASFAGVHSSITGTDVEYGRALGTPRPNKGDTTWGTTNGATGPGTSGCVIIRVPFDYGKA